MSEQDQATVSACSCKIGRNVERYDIDRLDEHLLERREAGASLRRLETEVNERILQSALEPSTSEVIGDVSTIYEQLTGDSTSAGKRTETEAWLSRAGIDSGALVKDFVSYQTVRTHLRSCLDIETDRQSTLSIEDANGTIEWARSRSTGIVERTIERLGKTDGFQTGDIEVGHVIRVSCSDCGTTATVESFLENGGCQCGPSAATDG